MTKRIAVEESLTNVTEALRERGFDVVEFQSVEDARNCAACVITGLDNNMMGIHDTVMDGPVIEASGLSADQVCQEVEQRLH
ncbi:YkuS family protein [Bacillus thermotolerans]|uniref:Uncharacterized protein n=1 Tax=Bacillus thermotolerans TaxID=1221996 RepID=A0A0F5HTT4_BACTR|nr:YkuS family protein [Bacillus thermotolerans]KKB33170.1 hypothetical protein QY97_03820 [Bacillus thermotolerans]KKB36267.1 hypothetical protein QY95_03131 [Bacillus thermotolerans]KKB44805.1 hypothetical protein QY96_01086 [Bacillus thermotolerans]